MLRVLSLLAALLIAAPPRLAAQPAGSCEAAIAAVEPGAGLPAGLLSAIARVESGRRLPGMARPEPWPWAINLGGQTRHAANRAEAVALVQAARAAGIRQIDVGCMQVSLGHHPDAFATLEEAFEPLANVTYAARFLGELGRRHGHWHAAIGRYHSGTPERSSAYLARVLAALEGQALAAPGAAPSAMRPDRVTVLQAPSARAVQVIVPGLAPLARLGPDGPALPRVITPGRP